TGACNSTTSSKLMEEPRVFSTWTSLAALLISQIGTVLHTSTVSLTPWETGERRVKRVRTRPATATRSCTPS
ncbi:hypothetical protein BDM02DRAFT_3106412, partial [Thelephora ganbajun]